MATAVDICNQALLHAGQSQTMASLSEGSTAASVFSTLWATSRDTVLRDEPWRFARRWATLAQLPASPTTDWLYAYALPSDCLAPRRVVGASRTAAPMRYGTASNGAQPILLCDAASVVLEYTARSEDTAQWPADFCTALALYLAAQACTALTVKYDVRAALLAEYRHALRNAATNAAAESVPDAPADCEFIAVRGVSPLPTSYL